jgi:hypothetical protein
MVEGVAMNAGGDHHEVVKESGAGWLEIVDEVDDVRLIVFHCDSN